MATAAAAAATARDTACVCVRALEPTVPRDRFYLLLQRGRYEEALELAHRFDDLNPNTVHEVRVNGLLDAAAAATTTTAATAAATAEQDGESSEGGAATTAVCVDELLPALDLVEDISFVVQSALHATVGSAQDVHRMLSYAHERLRAAAPQTRERSRATPGTRAAAMERSAYGGCAGAGVGDAGDGEAEEDEEWSALNAQVLAAMNRLATFQLASHGEFSSREWLRFMEADLYKELLFAVSSGRIGTASILWYRHARECGFQEQLASVLSGLPDLVPSTSFLTWFEHDLVPSVTRQDHAFVIGWARRRCLVMEHTEADTFPSCALNLISSADELLVVYGCSEKATSLAVRNVAGAQHPGRFVQMLCGDSREPAKQTAHNPAAEEARALAALRGQLQDIAFLRERAGFTVSVADHSRWSPTEIMIQMLDRTQACGLVEQVVSNDLVPYAERHSLCVDDVLESYVAHLASMQRNHGSAVLSNAWTGKALAIIPCIAGEQAKVRATIHMMRSVWVPCSPEVLALFEEARMWPAAQTREFQEHHRILTLKTTLLPYGVANENLSNVGVARSLIKVILANFDEPGAVQDALQVVGAYKHIPVSTVYTIRARNLCHRGCVEDACALLRSLSRGLTVAVGLELGVWALEHCKDAATYAADPTAWRNALRLGTEAMSVLMQLHEPLLAMQTPASASASATATAAGTTPTAPMAPSFAALQGDAALQHLGADLANITSMHATLRAMDQALRLFGVALGAAEFETQQGRRSMAAKLLRAAVSQEDSSTTTTTVAGAATVSSARGRPGSVAGVAKPATRAMAGRLSQRQSQDKRRGGDSNTSSGRDASGAEAAKHASLRRSMQQISQLLGVRFSEMVQLVTAWLLSMHRAAEFVHMILDVCHDVITLRPTAEDALNVLDVCERLLLSLEEVMPFEGSMDISPQLAVLARIKELGGLCVAECPASALCDALELTRACTLALDLAMQCEHSTDSLGLASMGYHGWDSEQQHQEQQQQQNQELLDAKAAKQTNKPRKQKRIAEQEEHDISKAGHVTQPPLDSTSVVCNDDNSKQANASAEGRKFVPRDIGAHMRALRSCLSEGTWQEGDGLVLDAESAMPAVLGLCKACFVPPAASPGLYKSAAPSVLPSSSSSSSSSSANAGHGPFSQHSLHAYEQRRLVGFVDSGSDGSFAAFESDDAGADGHGDAQARGNSNSGGGGGIAQALAVVLARAFEMFELTRQSNHLRLALSVALNAVGVCSQAVMVQQDAADKARGPALLAALRHTAAEQGWATYDKAVPLIADKVLDTLESLLRGSIGRPEPDVGLAASCLTLLPLEEGFACVRSGVKAAKQHYSKLSQLALLGAGGAILWNSEDVFGECSELYQNASWWHRLSNLSVPFEREWFSRQSPKFDFASVLEHSDFDLSLCLDLAADYGVPSDEVYCAYVEALCTTLVPSVMFVDRDEQVQVRRDLRDNALYMVQLLRSPDELLGTVVSSCLPKVNPYDYERIEFVLEVLGRVLQHVEARRAATTNGKPPSSSLSSSTSGARRMLRSSRGAETQRHNDAKAAGDGGDAETEQQGAGRVDEQDESVQGEASRLAQLATWNGVTWTAETIARAKHVLGVLQRFARQQDIPESEMQFTCEELGQELTPLHHDLGCDRLPFHHLLFGDALDILKPELSLESVGKLLPLARLLDLSTDDMYTAVIGEALTRAGGVDVRGSNSFFGDSEQQPQHARRSMQACSSGMVFEDGSGGVGEAGTSFSAIMGLLRKMESVECATACAKEVADVLPVGRAKVSVLEFAVEATERWLSAIKMGDSSGGGGGGGGPDVGRERTRTSAARRGAKIREHFVQQLKETKTLHMLQRARVEEEEVLALVRRPEELVVRLFETYTAGAAAAEFVSRGGNVYELTTAIGDLHDVDTEDIRQRLIEGYLKAGDSDGRAAKENSQAAAQQQQQQQQQQRILQESRAGLSSSSTGLGRRGLGGRSGLRSSAARGRPLTLGNLWGDDAGEDGGSQADGNSTAAFGLENTMGGSRSRGACASGLGNTTGLGRSFAGHQTIVHETVETADASTLCLHRAIALLRMVDVKESALFLIDFAMVEGSSKITLKARVRACIALFSITTLSFVAS